LKHLILRRANKINPARRKKQTGLHFIGAARFVIWKMELWLFLFFMPMRNDLDGRAEKAIRFPELIFQVAHIGKMEQFRIVNMWADPP
jgi:hypothetical protein